MNRRLPLYQALTTAAAAERTRSLRGVPQRLKSAARAMLSVKTTLLVAVLIAIGFVGFNIFQYPHYESDEGTYIGSAWAMFQHGALSYYTYTYDHPPFGWFLLGIWSTITGGFHTFGMSINSGRVLMLIAAVISTALVYGSVQRTTKNNLAALFAAVVFAVSPLGVSLHRQVWLDNIATLWLLLSLFMLLNANGRLWHIVLSAFAFGLAFWTKEVFVVFLPGMFLLAWTQAHPNHRRFALVLWAGVALSAISFFVLLALLKDELLPAGVLWSSNEPHVSMLETFGGQAERSGDGTLFSSTSQFRRFWGEWSGADGFLLVGGLIAALAGILMWRRQRAVAGLAALILIYLLFLGRGGVVLFYYIIPLLALMAVMIGMCVGLIANLLGRWRIGKVAAVIGLLALTTGYVAQSLQANKRNFTFDSTKSQEDVTRWIASNLPAESVLVMDSFPWVDLRDARYTGGAVFDNAHYYWPTLRDASVHTTLLDDNWRNIDYLVLSPSTEADIVTGSLANEPLLKDARANADEIQTFTSDEWAVKVLRIRKLQRHAAPSSPLLVRSWDTFKRTFVVNGQVVDTVANTTTAQAQADAMIRAVYMNDQDTFVALHDWTAANLQRANRLHASIWRNGDDAGVSDARSTSAADQDIAFALLLASRQWSEPDYANDARTLLAAIWQHEVVTVGGRPVLAAGDWATTWGSTQAGPTVYPGAFAPYAYRIFAEVDPTHNWKGLIDSSYDILNRAQTAATLGAATGLVPHALTVNAETMAVSEATDGALRNFDADAARVTWRLAQDWLWFSDNRARDTIRGYAWLWQQVANADTLVSTYDLAGNPLAGDENAAMYSAAIAGLLATGDDANSNRVFAEKIFRSYRQADATAYWGDATSLRDQTWGWNTSALMDGSFSNIWAGEHMMKWDDVAP